MLQIGAFARIAQVSVKTLRFYDERGLLRPAHVDEWSGYRLYALEQLPRLNRILALKDLGLSLEQIAALLNDRLTPEAIRGMLADTRADLARRIADEEARLRRVEERLQQIEREGTMSNYDVVLKRVEPQLVASVRETIPDWEQVQPTFNRIFDEVYAHVGRHGGKPAGAALDLWHAMGQTDMPVEAAAPLAGPIPESDRVKVAILPGVATMACAVHHGPFATLGEAHRAVARWAEANGYAICGPGREVYLQYERDGSQDDYVTEVQYPVMNA